MYNIAQGTKRYGWKELKEMKNKETLVQEILHKEPSLHTVFNNVPLIIRFTYITGNKQ